MRFTDPTPEDGGGANLHFFLLSYYEKQDFSTSPYHLSDEMKTIVQKLSAALPSVEVDGYAIHADGGMIYNPISDEQKASLHKYDLSAMYTGELKLGDKTLMYSIPKNVTAYDAVPLKYSLKSTAEITAESPVHISVSGFEDATRENGKCYYDLNLPGTVDVTYEYLGYVHATPDQVADPDLKLSLKNDGIAPSYPNYQPGNLVVSGTVPAQGYTWYKFEYTNTGDTVLDADGNGTFSFRPVLYKKEGNRWQNEGETTNSYYFLSDDLYPSETGTLWVAFFYLAPGDYKIDLNGIVRNEQDHPENYNRTIFDGEIATCSEFKFTVKSTAVSVITEPLPVEKTKVGDQLKRNAWLHSYEEFQSSYVTLCAAAANETVEDTVYVQLSPWCNQVVIKLMTGNNHNMTAVSVPVSVESDSLKIQFNPNNPAYVIKEDGTRAPAIMTQSMADMRINVLQSPYSEKDVTAYIAEMKDLGINVVNTTAGFMYSGTPGGNAFHFSMDIMRQLGLCVEGFSCYPYIDASNISLASAIAGKALRSGGVSSQALGEAAGILFDNYFKRWGDTFWQVDGTVIASVEDTRGGVGVVEGSDSFMRSSLDDESLVNFRIFLRSLYADINELNQAWGTDYKEFSEIQCDLSGNSSRGVYGKWSRALSDLDSYCTMERVCGYTAMIAKAEATAKDVKIDLRLEGSHWICKIDETSTNPNYRNVLVNQRGNAIIPELLGASDTVFCVSDYIWTAYRPSEVAYMTQSSLKDYGIVSANIPLFNRMRTIAINKKYGQSDQKLYNIQGENTKGVMVNTTVSLYEWWKATYENGGVPGLLWSDYACDGVATTTQRKEIAFFMEKLNDAMNTDESKKWATEFDSKASVLDSSLGLYSYNSDFVAKCIEEYYN